MPFHLIFSQKSSYNYRLFDYLENFGKKLPYFKLAKMPENRDLLFLVFLVFAF
jgi:hypothetical protein